MNNNTDKLIDDVLESYGKYQITARIDEDNIVNREILIEIVEEIRKLLFPGFFDKNKVSSEFLRYLVGRRIEFIKYNLKEQVAKSFGNIDECCDSQRSCILKKAEKIVNDFIGKIPVIREYLATDIQAAYKQSYRYRYSPRCNNRKILFYRPRHGCCYWRNYDNRQ